MSYEMKSVIVKCKSTKETAQITHWDHFFVNRYTGRTANNYCTVQIIDGKCRGHRHSVPCEKIGDCDLTQAWEWVETND